MMWALACGTCHMVVLTHARKHAEDDPCCMKNVRVPVLCWSAAQQSSTTEQDMRCVRIPSLSLNLHEEHVLQTYTGVKLPQHARLGFRGTSTWSAA